MRRKEFGITLEFSWKERRSRNCRLFSQTLEDLKIRPILLSDSVFPCNLASPDEKRTVRELYRGEKRINQSSDQGEGTNLDTSKTPEGNPRESRGTPISRICATMSQRKRMKETRENKFSQAEPPLSSILRPNRKVAGWSACEPAFTWHLRRDRRWIVAARINIYLALYIHIVYVRVSILYGISLLLPLSSCKILSYYI